MKPTVVLGLGNPLMADEGIGVYLIERLASSADKYPDVDIIDAGTGGLSILHHVEGRRKAIIIDCAFMGEPPGAMKRFTPEEVRSVKVLAHHSLHEADLVRVLMMAQQLGQAPEQVVIFGIEPERVQPGRGLSPTLMDRIDEYQSVILSELLGVSQGEHMGQGGILIIDDDPDIIEAMTVVLENKGYEVRRARDGAEGMERLKEARPDLIILDVMMRTSQEGFELSRELKHNAQYQDIPILILTAVKQKTGLDFKDTAGDASWLPVEEYLDKPIRPDVLLEKVGKLLQKS